MPGALPPANSTPEQPASHGDPAVPARLEGGELLQFTPAPFALPEEESLQFLRTCHLHSRLHKNITLNPRTNQLTGVQGTTDEARLRRILANFGQTVADWLAAHFPQYARCWVRDRISYRPEEEAIRRLRLRARNDLLHIDSFPTRPTRGARLLRLYVNINPTEPRVWATSDTFPELLARYGQAVGLPTNGEGGWSEHLRQRVLALFRPADLRGSAYDDFMLRLHHFLKGCEEFQENSIRRLWHFPPASAWLAFTDGLSHAELRGQYALEHSFFIPLEGLTCPERAPIALLQQMCRGSDLRRSA